MSGGGAPIGPNVVCQSVSQFYKCQNRCPSSPDLCSATYFWFYCDTHLKVLIIQADLKIEGVSQANLTLNIFSSLINLPDFNFYVAATTLSRAILIFPNEVSTIFFSFKQFKCFTLDSFSLTSG